MPSLPPRPCTYPNCGQYAAIRGRCLLHKRESNWASNQTKRKGWDWTRKKAAILKRDQYLCQRCFADGDYRRADEVDHIKPLSDGGTDDPANLMSLCAYCHKQKSKSESGFLFSWIRHPACEVILVYGAPASGKSTYCMQRATRQDEVIDLDQIISELSGQSRKDVDKSVWLRRATIERNKRLDALHTKRLGKAYVITTTPTRSERQTWIDKLKPSEVICLSPLDAYQCIERLRNDSTRSDDQKKIDERVILDWYTKHS